MYVTNNDESSVSVINLCPRPQWQQQRINDIIMTTANNIHSNPFFYWIFNLKY
jgi:hypothetical protein